MMLRAILTTSVVFLGTLPATYGQASIPPGFEVIQLTDTPVRDAWPRINNQRQVVYERRVNGTSESGEIFLYDDRTGQTIRLTNDNVKDAFPDINDDGTLSGRRPFANLAAPTDGISLDDEGCIWVACPYFSYGDSGGWVRVADGGEIKRVIPLEDPDKSAYACMLGGADGRDLYLCESTVLGRERFQGDGRIRRVRVDVPMAENQF
ncbi:MAG: SMP-30/gluconolactonase/LRE family protein [Planctomycetes bacterium]|nr:SMP-30/gluconolactonase/LRE family protein [Planctomycetota bacterium]